MMYGDIGRVLTWTPLEQPMNGYDATISVPLDMVHFESLYAVSCSALAVNAGNVVALAIVAVCVTVLYL